MTDNNNYIHLLGDVHGHINQYNNLISRLAYSVQIGDMGFDYSKIKPNERHVWFGGNHECYYTINNHANNLGDYGLKTLNGVTFYFVRGAFSIDKEYRLAGQRKNGVKTWWENEELSKEEFEEVVKDYYEKKPNIVLTHDCPDSVSRIIGNPEILRGFGFDPDTFNTITQTYLEKCFIIHQPKLWVFGHYHKHFDQVIGGTRFICLPELKYITINNEGEVIC